MAKSAPNAQTSNASAPAKSNLPAAETKSDTATPVVVSRDRSDLEPVQPTAVSAAAPQWAQGLVATVDPARDDVRCVVIELPMRPSKTYAATSLRDLRPAQAKLMREVADGLAAEGIMLANGRKIECASDVISYICERLQS